LLFLTLHTFQSKGGIETFNQYFLSAFDRNNISYKSISLHDKLHYSEQYHLTCSGSIVKFIWYILTNLKNSQIIIWGHINLLPLFWFLYPLLKNKRNILIVHGIDVWNPLYKTYFKEKSIKKIDEVWSVSNYTKKRFVENYSFPFEKIQLFHNTIVPKKLNNPNPYNNQKSVKILSILRLQNKEKVLSVLRILEVLPHLLKKYDVEFYIIGEGIYKSYLINYIRDKNLDKYAHILGQIDDTAPYLEHSDIFSLISHTEGFGIVLLEAMQYAKPCIAAINTGSEDVVRNNESGFLVNPDNDLEIIEKLSLLIENKELRNKMGKQGQKIFETNFTFEHFCEKQKQLLLF
jgi:glycosyltransferase involved in cell wall biosynthesis